jgi:hypothetical protein
VEWKVGTTENKSQTNLYPNRKGKKKKQGNRALLRKRAEEHVTKREGK